MLLVQDSVVDMHGYNTALGGVEYSVQREGCVSVDAGSQRMSMPMRMPMRWCKMEQGKEICIETDICQSIDERVPRYH